MTEQSGIGTNTHLSLFKIVDMTVATNIQIFYIPSVYRTSRRCAVRPTSATSTIHRDSILCVPTHIHTHMRVQFSSIWTDHYFVESVFVPIAITMDAPIGSIRMWSDSCACMRFFVVVFVMLWYNSSFPKSNVNIIHRIYWRHCHTVYNDDHDDDSYRVCLKGHYNRSSLHWLWRWT